MAALLPNGPNRLASAIFGIRTKSIFDLALGNFAFESEATK
jgi:hypothetical protein